VSKRKTHLIGIYFIGNKGCYEDYNEIKKVADALKNKLEYIRKTNDDYFINAYIGISNLNLRYGHFKYAKNKKSGRSTIVVIPKKKYQKEKEKCFEPWHLHILIEANPAETIGELIVDYFNKKFDKEIAQKKKIDNGFFPYVLKQSRYQRFVRETRPTKLVRYDFKDMHERYGKPKTKTRIAREKLVIQQLEERSWKRHEERLVARR
jgi:hypothetical protein